MIQLQRVLCPVDFSDFSRRAFDHAVRLAHWYQSTVRLLYVSEGAPLAAAAPGGGVVPSGMLTAQERESLLTGLKHFASSGAGADLEFEIGEGDVAKSILSQAAEGHADVVVLGTHGRSGFERLVLGSVAEKVLRKATCPVLTVPQAVGDVVPVTPTFKRIVCPIDFSTCSMHALEYAFSMAQEDDAHVTVLHVIDVPANLEADGHGAVQAGSPSLRGYLAATERERRARVADAVPDHVRTYCTVDTVVTSGSPYREILRAASERKGDLIIMGIHGRHPLDLLFFGSTTQHVVRRAACPVLTLRQE